MTSSIYPILVSLSTPIIDAPGSDYKTTPTVTIDSPSTGTGIQATGTAVIANGVINSIALSGTLTSYTDGEEITLSGGTGTGATATAVITSSTIQSIAFTNRGSGYSGSDVITITGDSSGTNAATIDVNSIVANGVSSIIITNGGIDYTSLPTITITGGGGTGATAIAVFNIKDAPILATDNNILNSDIEITNDMVKPGGGGILRLSFSFTIDADATISVFNDGSLKGDLNADNNSLIVSDGYYRFDIDVEAGDAINLQSSQNITLINFLRVHLVQFGA